MTDREMCDCSGSSVCPLGKSNSPIRCTRRELCAFFHGYNLSSGHRVPSESTKGLSASELRAHILGLTHRSRTEAPDPQAASLLGTGIKIVLGALALTYVLSLVLP